MQAKRDSVSGAGKRLKFTDRGDIGFCTQMTSTDVSRLAAHKRRIQRIVPILLSSLTVACGGGGGGAVSPPPPPPVSGWQQGIFQSAGNFINRCEAPRAGTNPATGSPYPDTQGSVLDENNYLRSHSNDTYLWYDDVVDQDPGLFNDPLIYFDELVTDDITPSGAPVDKFHFTVPSDEWFQFSQAGISAGYGAQFVLLSATPPREIRVAYVNPNTPATDPQVNLERGAEILEIDGFDINTSSDAGIDALNAGLFPGGSGETHTFVVRDLGSQDTRTVTMTSAQIVSTPVQETSVITRPNGDRVGYFILHDFIATAEEGLVDAVDQLASGQGIDDLIVDMRYNGGGFLAIGSQLAYMIAGPTSTNGRVYELPQWNDKHPTIDPVTGQAIQAMPFFSQTLGFDNLPANQVLPNLGLPRVFVITGSESCSTTEAVINSLQGVGIDVIQVGSTTCGKPYGFYASENCGTAYFLVQFRGVNDIGFGDYTDGFSPANSGIQGTTVPGCSVGDDFNALLGDPAEARLAATLTYRDNQTCPAATGNSNAGISKPTGRRVPADGIVPKSIWQKNRIMEMPQ